MTFIIAEVGVNHNGDLNKSKKIIDFCMNNKIDAVKFQTFKAKDLALKKTQKVKYQKNNAKDNENHYQMLKRLELSQKDHKILKNYSEKRGVEFISTPYDVESAKFLISLNLKTIKVSSADLTDHYLHEFLSKTKKKIIISTGMSNLKDVKRTVSIYNRDSRLSLLHCVSNYPCSLSSLNLNNIDTLKKFGYEVGFSDHSKDHLSSALAIAKGAKIIEKHITLDNNSRTRSQSIFNLKDFKKFLENIRITNKILGSYEKKSN